MKKNNVWKLVLQIAVSALTALATALGVS
ncbi:MAG: smalltalk protein [Segatella salivae]|nr:smalltalk protein [Segatella salivae]MBF1542831.1 smalltalk protein [Segatella salivae]MBW4765540.1 smalltalk protein [Segatella salivae]